MDHTIQDESNPAAKPTGGRDGIFLEASSPESVFSTRLAWKGSENGARSQTFVAKGQVKSACVIDSSALHLGH